MSDLAVNVKAIDNALSFGPPGNSAHRLRLIAATIPPCPKCGRNHRHWRTYAACVLAPNRWVIGHGAFASVSDCPRGRTVQLYECRADAEAAKKFIDLFACGGMCCRLHRVVDLRGEGAE